MSKYSGYMGRVAKFDLSTGKFEDYPWSDKDRELYIGGKVMAAKILLDNLTGKEEALSSDNIVVISTGPLTGSGVPSACRFDISTISPVTGLIASESCGGNFGYHLKRAGFDALVLTGKCSGHSWLEIYNDGFVLHDADAQGIWGQRISDAQQSVQDILDRDYGCRVKCGIMVIGPAGENLVSHSGIFGQERIGCSDGLGAVFGAKNLKAIAAAGNHAFTVANPKKDLAWNRKWISHLREHPLTGDILPKLGSPAIVGGMQDKKLLGSGESEGCTVGEGGVTNVGCIGCPVKCERAVPVSGGIVRNPEYKALSRLSGSNDTILKWNRELDELGLDAVFAAETLAWAIDAHEKGVWKNDLSSDEAAVSALWEDIALRKGAGAELAEGCEALSKKYGGDCCSDASALAAYEPCTAISRKLSYSAGNLGGCMAFLESLGVNASAFSPKLQANLTVLMQSIFETISASGQCVFTGYAALPGAIFTDGGKSAAAFGKLLSQFAPIIGILNKLPELAFFPVSAFHHDRAMKYTVGMSMTPGKYIRSGMRGCTLERSLDALFGVADKEQTAEGEDDSVIGKLKKEYYSARGWDKNGVPTQAALAKLKIKKGAS